MQSTLGRFRFPIAVAFTSLALVGILGVAGALVARNAFAGGWFGGSGYGPGWGGPSFTVPPEVEGLRDVPASERFDHFKGVQLNLTDRDDRPLAVNAVPGTVTSSTATSLTIAANDGSTKTYTLNDQTIIRGTAARQGTEATAPMPTAGAKVVVVTLNNAPTATAVLVGGANGFFPHAAGGWHGRGGW